METIITMNAMYKYLQLEPAFQMTEEEFLDKFRKSFTNFQKGSKILPVTLRFVNYPLSLN